MRVGGWVYDGDVIVTVADAGPGIAAERVSNLFNRFERAGASWPEGVGLGLALVATYARRQGGRISCISRPGIGTVFELLVPAS